MRMALSALLAGLLCAGCGVSAGFDAEGGSHRAACYPVGSPISNGPFGVTIKSFPVPAVPLLNGKPARAKAGGMFTTVTLTNTSAGVVSVSSGTPGFLIDSRGRVVSATPDPVTSVGHTLVPLKPGHSQTFQVGVNVERRNAAHGKGLPAGLYRMRIQITYALGEAPVASMTIPGRPLKTISSVATVPVVLR